MDYCINWILKLIRTADFLEAAMINYKNIGIESIGAGFSPLFSLTAIPIGFSQNLPKMST